MKKKFLLVFLVLFCLSAFLTAKNAFAYYSSKGNKTEEFETAVFDTTEFNIESHTNTTTESIISSLNTMILGCTTEACQKKLGTNASGAVGSVSNLIASLYANPPASSTYYLADLGQRLNIVQPAYAQGIGFSGLRPLLPLWRASRNVAYIFFILIFIITGFAIMFRAKINPQTVVTIQAAIPKVIIALILVTFSYAIAGLMIDLMYLLIGLIFGVIPANFKDFLPHGSEVSYYYTGGFGELIHNVWDAGWGSFWRVFQKGGWVPESGTAGIAAIIGAIISSPHRLAAFLLGGGGVVVLFIFIAAIIILFTTIKIFWTLLISYVNIIIGILVAPIQLMLSAIPGQNTFGPWISNLLKNILVFPATVGMLILAFIFGDFLEINSNASLWAPPLLGFAGEQAGQAMGALLSFGIILMTPKVADIIKSMFEKKPFPYGAAIGQAMGPAKGIGGLGLRAGGFATGVGLDKYSKMITPSGAPKRGTKAAGKAARFLETIGVYKK